MYIKKIEGKNFRKFERLKFYFHPFLNIILGENGKGKTSLLEAIYFSLTAEGFRERKEVELLRFNENELGITSELIEGDEKILVQINLKKTKEGVDKKIFVNKLKRKISELPLELPWPLLFTPEDLKIIIGEPEIRRNYLDKILSKIEIKYRAALLNYEHALKRRNKILSLKEEKNVDDIEDELKFWDEYLEKNGKIITQKREEFFRFCNENNDFFGFEFKIKYLKNEFSIEKSKKLRKKELERGFTLSGPHRDDFKILLKKEDFIDIKIYGSRSEQRLAVLWLKKMEAEFVKHTLKIKGKGHFRPILLLDDVFSELDEKNKKRVLKFIEKYQCFITSSSPEIVNQISLPYHLTILK